MTKRKYLSSIFIILILGGLGYYCWNLSLKYDKLTADYESLSAERLTLRNERNALQVKYDSLFNDFKALNTKYAGLTWNYSLLELYFDKPIANKVIPTLQELNKWLLEDSTSRLKYDDPDFVCRDFAVTLALHARTKHWDMGVVGIKGYDINIHERYSHAVNAIITTEGLVYIDPQIDYVWWYSNHEAIRVGGVYRIPLSEYISQYISVEVSDIILSYC